MADSIESTHLSRMDAGFGFGRAGGAGILGIAGLGAAGAAGVIGAGLGKFAAIPGPVAGLEAVD